MAYFLGRDVDIAITTEHATQGVVVKEWTNLASEKVAGALNFAQTGSTAETIVAAGDKSLIFAGPKAASTVGGTTYNGAFGDLTGDGTDLKAITWDNQPNNITALDVSLGVQDEDVAFIGQRNILKAEVKKENSITITRKKSDTMWDAVYNDARFGIKESNSITAPTATVRLPGMFDGLSAPDFVGCGYRLIIRFAEAPAIATAIVDQSGGIPAGDTTLNFDSTTGMVAGDYLEFGGPTSVNSTGGTVNEHEIIKIGTVASATQLTGCTRAQKGTEAFALADNDKCVIRGAGTGEVLVMRNCYVTEHSVTLQVDGSQEESMTFMSYTDPKVYDGITGGEWDDATTASEL